MDELEALDRATARYEETEAEHDTARADTIAAIVAALRAGAGPTVVADRSPFKAAYVRRIAREHGIEPAAPGPKKLNAAMSKTNAAAQQATAAAQGLSDKIPQEGR
ncbi:hypothetical protein V2S66_31280 [Streptomyces sp. V4-01]|uniref:Uncharacterized protein n=1 Tax=Actinacidiphila polyblastidii TaxID=3110430 RepID=A0ABU7PKT1_9ACTN|nr:hypothetical protein [Streptomyces sp. V4-01]